MPLDSGLMRTPQPGGRMEEALSPERTFHIFRGTALNATLLEIVSGRQKGLARMKELAAQKPDSYFLWDDGTHRIVAEVRRRPAA